MRVALRTETVHPVLLQEALPRGFVLCVRELGLVESLVTTREHFPRGVIIRAERRNDHVRWGSHYTPSSVNIMSRSLVHALRSAISGWYSGELYQRLSASMSGNSMMTTRSGFQC